MLLRSMLREGELAFLKCNGENLQGGGGQPQTERVEIPWEIIQPFRCLKGDEKGLPVSECQHHIKNQKCLTC